MATIPGFELFNGATMSRIVDGAGAIWLGCCAKKNGVFGFYIFKNGIEVPYAPFCKDRGQVTKDGWWTAWEGPQYYEGALPGFVPIPTGSDTSALEARIAALEQQIASLPPTVTGSPLRVPPVRTPIEGGEVQLADGAGGPPWVIDVYSGTLRFIHNGVVIEYWPK